MSKVSARPRVGNKVKVRRLEVKPKQTRWASDDLAVEEPLELRLVAGNERKTVAVTLRTPGNDFELAAGFLFGEGVIQQRSEIRRIAYCVDEGAAFFRPDRWADQRYNIVNVELRAEALPELAPLERHFFTTSACGLCGKASLESLSLRGLQPLLGDAAVTAEVLRTLPEKLRNAQKLFDLTGGLHAAGLFDLEGHLIALREDIGRHNAMDKLVGWAFLEGKLPLAQCIVVVSGRASFELVQKALNAGIPIFASVSAPSNLAVDLATSFGLTLVGFLRGERFNIYAHPERILLV
ncbi:MULTISPECIES: formate dehydrogenase accessory sulfurtransferase FdhD [unclassified Meiothermus]|uniref:formate dehydrogenase accessory sulfurtransferase FdhD n=1 Tax=unclassified Meiothermus TaxID=370471 RepID=UPI000D7BC7EB|nr:MULTISPECIES: formate dehydrogenase accessory sulfurtransferase FdhD [unclassified Meiothermus]PZA06510.1 formate dehydrogenase accessory sulfurtransferase FdhD [Meiothermus sp. Pnk-1]RYM37184.1 formate dehydrogenase accessory sulfurtransferase FdhD [Meiothermus sp. PNK-Is4]